jgi:hypothetical protein
MMRIDVFVEQAKGADRLAPLVRKEGILNPMFGCKPGQHIHRIIADRKEGNMGALEVGEPALQLNELRLAEWSPHGAAMEDHQGAMLASGLVQIDEIAMLIWEDDLREAGSDCRADLAKVNGARHVRSSFLYTLLRCYIGGKGCKKCTLVSL